MMDARRSEVYAGLYSTASGSPEALVEPRALKALDFVSALEGHDEIILLGQGALVYREDIEAAFKGRAHYPPAHLMVPSPAAVASLGLGILEAGDLPDPISLTPTYLRKSEAETKAG
jgi:tRNA threonylcarbamoyladenosine biosynthesis protein TsaB